MCLLLDRDAKMEDNYGLDSLTAAASRGWAAILEILCHEGIDITRTEEREYNVNPMLMAIKNGHNYLTRDFAA